jgi:dephospho-CoA kinase
MKQNKFIAITGGIGSGKSMVGNIVGALGGYVIDTDKINRGLLVNPAYIRKLQEIFPSAVNNGVIDKAELSRIVFSDKQSLIKLNALAHPLISGIVMYEASLHSDKHVFVEIPLLKESGLKGAFDRVWYIDSIMEKRIERVLNRDGRSREEIKKIIASQSLEDKELATDIILNNGTEEQLWAEVQKLYLSL